MSAGLALCVVWFVLGMLAGFTIGRETVRRGPKS